MRTEEKRVGDPDRLRSDIDRGKAHDKVRARDPSLTPLRTDDEAGGSPVTPLQVQKAREQETAPIPATAQGPEQTDGTHYAESKTGRRLTLMAFAVPIVLIAIAILFAVWR